MGERTRSKGDQNQASWEAMATIVARTTNVAITSPAPR